MIGPPAIPMLPMYKCLLLDFPGLPTLATYIPLGLLLYI